MSVQESLVEAWVSSGLLQGLGLKWTFWRRSQLSKLLRSSNREGTQPSLSTENWIKDLLSMAPPIRTRPSFPLSQSLQSGSFHKYLILIHQRADRMKTKITEHLQHSLNPLWHSFINSEVRVELETFCPRKRSRSLSYLNYYLFFFHLVSHSVGSLVTGGTTYASEYQGLLLIFSFGSIWVQLIFTLHWASKQIALLSLVPLFFRRLYKRKKKIWAHYKFSEVLSISYGLF